MQPTRPTLFFVSAINGWIFFVLNFSSRIYSTRNNAPTFFTLIHDKFAKKFGSYRISVPATVRKVFDSMRKRIDSGKLHRIFFFPAAINVFSYINFVFDAQFWKYDFFHSPASSMRCLTECCRPCQNCHAFISSSGLFSSRNISITTLWGITSRKKNQRISKKVRHKIINKNPTFVSSFQLIKLSKSSSRKTFTSSTPRELAGANSSKQHFTPEINLFDIK